MRLLVALEQDGFDCIITLLTAARSSTEARRGCISIQELWLEVRAEFILDLPPPTVTTEQRSCLIVSNSSQNELSSVLVLTVEWTLYNNIHVYNDEQLHDNHIIYTNMISHVHVYMTACIIFTFLVNFKRLPLSVYIRKIHVTATCMCHINNSSQEPLVLKAAPDSLRKFLQHRLC